MGFGNFVLMDESINFRKIFVEVFWIFFFGLLIFSEPPRLFIIDLDARIIQSICGKLNKM